MRANLHVGWPQRPADGGATGRARRRVRQAAGVLALANALVYGLIGAGIARVTSDAQGDTSFLWVFGLTAGTAFLLGAILLWAFDRRLLWWLGAAFQVFAIVAYVGVAPQRVPPFEAWGLSLKVAQGVLLVALLHLALTQGASWRASRRARVG
ncbi:MAG: hypothetical protein P8Y13_08360 [Deinococcales bacterium]|jgi:hypothetical protein